MGSGPQEKRSKRRKNMIPDAPPSHDLRADVLEARRAAAQPEIEGLGVGGAGRNLLETFEFDLVQVDPAALNSLRLGATCRLPPRQRFQVYHSRVRVGRLPKHATSVVMRIDPSKVIVMALDVEAAAVRVRLYPKR